MLTAVGRTRCLENHALPLAPQPATQTPARIACSHKYGEEGATNTRGDAHENGAASRSLASFASILDEDPDLGQGLSAPDRRLAEALLHAPVIAVAPSRWEPPEYDADRALGFLVLDGLLGQRVRIGPAVVTELLTRGDILRPWDSAADGDLIANEHEWKVFGPARIAVLDERITAVIGHVPELGVAISARIWRRSHARTCLMAVTHLQRVEDKLLGSFWLLAQSCGRVTRDGIKIPFTLTHAVIGEIIGAQRPSVTLAVKRLMERGQMRRDPDGAYVLTGDPLRWAEDCLLTPRSAGH